MQNPQRINKKLEKKKVQSKQSPNCLIREETYAILTWEPESNIQLHM